MTEPLLNMIWGSLAIFAFAVVLPKIEGRRRLAGTVALTAILALLFPIISISDDLSADSTAREVLAVLFTVVGPILVFGSPLRLTPTAPKRLVVAALESFDPRSPPRG